MKLYFKNSWAKLYHGDCSERDFEYDLLITDPPYGMGFRSTHRQQKYDKIIGDDKFPAEQVKKMIEGARAGAYVFCRWKNLLNGDLPLPRSLMCWTKNIMGVMHRCEHEHRIQWEGIAFYPQKGHRFRKQISDVVFSPRTNNQAHPTQKPLWVLNRLIEVNDGEVVFDPYAGSGTTMLAAGQCRRKAIGIEIEEKYCEVAARRLEKGAWVNLF